MELIQVFICYVKDLLIILFLGVMGCSFSDIIKFFYRAFKHL